MLTIRSQQMSQFRQSALAAFEDEMVVHSKRFSPRLSRVLGDDRLRVAVRDSIQRAGAYGFTNRGPIRLFIELTFTFGSSFDTDPQYPWAAKFLHAFEHQMQRAERLHRKTLDYLDKVAGPGNANTVLALRALPGIADRPLPFSSQDLVAGMMRELARVFPQKAAYVGDEGLRALISEGGDLAHRYRYPEGRGEALVIVLMFAFGHGCADDLLYPWISRTVHDERMTDPSIRAARLEKRALTWLKHVLA